MSPLQLRNDSVDVYARASDHIDDVISQIEHRRNRRLADADRIRDQLAAHGVIVEDAPTGARWRTSTR